MNDLTKLTDEQLAMLYIDGNNRAFDLLLSRNQSRLFSYIIFVVKDRDVAEDIFQETFVKVITRLQQGRYVPSGKFAAWLMKISHNVIMDWYREQRSEKVVDASDNGDLSRFAGDEELDTFIEQDFVNNQIYSDVRHMMEHPVLHSPHSYRIHELDVADFYAYDTANGDDRTADLIYAEGPVMLIVAPDLSAADQGCVGLLNEAYDYAVLHGIPCYCLTASDAEAQANWNEHTGAEYPCLQSDERMLKTIVRANPGLVVLSDGKVVAKWSNWNLPDEAELDSLLFPRQPQPTQFNH